MNTTHRRAWLGLALSFCALTAQAQEKTVVTLSRFFGACEADYGSINDAAKARGECGIITTLVNQFNATNTLNVVVKPQIVEWGPYYDQLTARIVAKDVPTIAVMHESVLGDFVSRKLVEPLDDGLKKAGVDTATYSAQAKTGTTFDGKTYALPFDTWAWLWHVNVNLFKKAGLVDASGAPVLPKTPDELLAQARKFKEATGKPYFAWTTANETAAPTRTFLTLVNQQGGQLFKGRTIDVKGKEARAAMDLMAKLWSEGHI
jgi:multiple sugar transport system substrate-binding protein